MSNKIHHTAVVHSSAKIHEGVEIGAFSIIHSNVILGENTYVGSHCELGIPTKLGDQSALIIGSNSTIRSHSIFYESSTFGEGLMTGHRVTVREKTTAGKNLQIGTLSDIQGDCSFGDYVRLHSNVHIGKMSRLEDFVWIFPFVVLTNDPTPPSDNLLGVTIEKFAIVATMAVILPGVKVGRHALVAAHACVGKDVPPQMIAAGVPSKILGPTSNIKQIGNSNESAYPWPKHFRRGYPDEITNCWDEEFQ